MNRDRFWGIQFDPANVWFLLVATLAGALTATVLGQPLCRSSRLRRPRQRSRWRSWC